MSHGQSNSAERLNVQALITRREVFWSAFWAGLAAPAMLFAGPTAYVLYDGNAGLQQAWGDVGSSMTSTLTSVDGQQES